MSEKISVYLDEEVCEIIQKVNDYFKNDYSKTALWLRTKNMNFGDIAPIKLIQFGKAKKVLQFIDSNED